MIASDKPRYHDGHNDCRHLEYHHHTSNMDGLDMTLCRRYRQICGLHYQRNSQRERTKSIFERFVSKSIPSDQPNHQFRGLRMVEKESCQVRRPWIHSDFLYQSDSEDNRDNHHLSNADFEDSSIYGNREHHCDADFD